MASSSEKQPQTLYQYIEVVVDKTLRYDDYFRTDTASKLVEDGTRRSLPSSSEHNLVIINCSNTKIITSEIFSR